MFQSKSQAFAFAMASLLFWPLVLSALIVQQGRLQGVYGLAPLAIGGLTVSGFVYGLKRAWRIYRAERDERVRERIRQKMRRRYS